MCLAFSSGCPFSLARSCTCLCIMGTAITEASINRIATGEHHERRNARLRLMEPCHCQLGRLHLLCLYFLQAADPARLAFVQRFQRVPGRVVCGDVWIPADDLLPVGMAAVTISQRGL